MTTMTTTATNNPGSPTNNNGSINGSSNGKATRARAATTPIEAAGKISKILDHLSPADRKRVLAFVSEGVE